MGFVRHLMMYQDTIKELYMVRSYTYEDRQGTKYG